MSRDGASADPFFTGGALPPDSLSYVQRTADDELFDAVLAGEVCCVFAPSLMVRTARRLEQRGFRTITADLARFNADSSVVQSFQYLTMRLKYQLKLSVDPVTWWWAEQAYSDPTQGIVNFLRDEVLNKFEGPVAIFLDGIDTTLNSDILDSLLTTILSLHQARETDPVWHRLTFVLLGSAIRDDLIKDHSHFPFRGCHNIDLHEFGREEAQVLQHSLPAACLDDAGTVFSRIFYWSNGHPYLTQKLCMAAANAQDADCTDEWVDRLVKRVFLAPEAGIESNLQFVRDSIRTNRSRKQLLSCYRRVYKGKKVAEDERSFAQNQLKLIGLVRSESGTLKVRNEVYRSAFDSAWIKANMPVNWTFRVAVVAALLIILLVGFASFAFSQQQWITEAHTPTPTPSPTSVPPTPTPTETSVPSTSTPTAAPTATPTVEPTATREVLTPEVAPAVTPTVEPTATREVLTPEVTPTATPTVEPTATREVLTPEVAPATTPTAEPTATPTSKPTTVPTATSTPTLTPTPPTPTAAPTSAAQLSPPVPSGTFTLLKPLSLDDPTYGPTDFVWEWSGSMPPDIGFEVRVWRKGEPQAGAHDALLDNQSGNIQNIGGKKYRLNTNIEGAAGVRGRSGIYSWTVALVQISPGYADLGQQAKPAQLRLELNGTGDDDTGGGGGVGIE
jgi:hypothetical protein